MLERPGAGLCRRHPDSLCRSHRLTRLILPRWPAVGGGGAGAGEEPAAGADPQPGGALPGPGGPSAASGPHRGPAGELISPLIPPPRPQSRTLGL